MRRNVPLALQVKVDGELFKVGQHAYVIRDLAKFKVWERDFHDREPAYGCAVCGRGDEGEEEGETPLYECDFCLRGFHSDCLETADQDRVVQSDVSWRCPECRANAAHKTESLAQLLVFGDAVVGLVQIESIWRDSSTGDAFVDVRWFVLRRETCMPGAAALEILIFVFACVAVAGWSHRDAFLAFHSGT